MAVLLYILGSLIALMPAHAVLRDHCLSASTVAELGLVKYAMVFEKDKLRAAGNAGDFWGVYNNHLVLEHLEKKQSAEDWIDQIKIPTDPPNFAVLTPTGRDMFVRELTVGLIKSLIASPKIEISPRVSAILNDLLNRYAFHEGGSPGARSAKLAHFVQYNFYMNSSAAQRAGGATAFAKLSWNQIQSKIRLTPDEEFAFERILAIVNRKLDPLRLLDTP